MSSERNKYILIGLVILLTVAGYYLLKDSFSEWDFNLDKTKKNAYGTYLTYELLKQKNKKTGFIEIDNSITETFRKLKKDKTYNYIFLNQTPYYDSATVDTICKFAEAGNTVFISCEGFYGPFIDSVLYKTYHLRLTTGYNEIYYKLFEKDTTFGKNIDIEDKRFATFNFIHSSLKDDTGYTYFIKYKADTLTNYYYRFEPVADTDWTQPIPEINGISFAGYEKSYGTGLNFAVLKHGKGQFIILLSAIPFTNYFMRTENGLEFAEKIWAHLPNQTTIWDNISHKYKYLGDDKDNSYHGDSSIGESPLYFILKNKALRWSWYLTILGIITFAVFHAKRRQNIIPIIETKHNNSLKYVETIGQLYLHESEHIEIANEMRLQFMNFIRQKYYIKTNEIDDSFFKQLSLKSAIEEEKIRTLFDDFTDVLKIRSINQNRLHSINKQLEYFYKTCK